MARGRSNFPPACWLALLLLISAALHWGDVVSFRPAQQTAYGAEDAPTDARAQLRSLFEALHHPEQPVVETARAQLARLGFTDRQIDVAAQLVDPDPRVRLSLARSLGDLDQPMLLSIAEELSRDESESIRAATIESLQKIPPTARLAGRVREMADSDSSPIVRGHARLLQADWSQSTRARSIEPDSVSPRHRAVPPLAAVQLQRARSFGANSFGPSPVPAVGQSVMARSIEPDSVSAGGRAATGSLFRPVKPYWTLPDGVTDSEPDYMSPGASSFDLRDGILATGGRFAQPPLPPAPREFPGLTESGSIDRREIDQRDDMEIRPGLLRPPGDVDELDGPEGRFADDYESLVQETGALLNWETGAPLGFAGPSGVLPTEYQQNSHFVPVEDRWRSGFPAWDRYDKGHPPVDDYPYVEGHWWDPYNQNVLKGDYPIIGQHTFLRLTGTSLMLHEFREVPTPTTPFESTRRPRQEEFFGDPFQYFYNHNFAMQIDLFHGSEAFKPFDWQARVTPVFNINHLNVGELGVVNPDVRRGTHRTRTDVTLEEWFIEAKLADLSPSYDFASVRAGSQLFNSDFRGFIFNDINRAVRLFGTRLGNRDQFNIIWFDQTEKETNSLLNTFEDRHQNTLIANYYRQDFIFPGYTAAASFHYNTDGPSFKFDRNNFLVRPDPAGVFQQHKVEAYYFGITGDGHIGRYNVSNAFYWVVGHDDLNPIAGRPVDINAQFAAIELSYDRDWVRFRTSFLWASGDDDPNDGTARGFDTIFDNPNFAGGEFTYWQRQAVRLFGVNLVQRQSLVPNLRSSKFQGQSNFVNPGLSLVNAGMDFEITPKMRAVTNANFLWFNSTAVLETFTFQDRINPKIGTDLSLGVEYRPFLNDNVQIIGGLAWLIPSDGFKDLYGQGDISLAAAPKVDVETLFSHFMQVILIY